MQFGSPADRFWRFLIQFGATLGMLFDTLFEGAGNLEKGNISHNYENFIWEASRRYLGDIWAGRHLGGIWVTPGRHLGNIWEHLGDIHHRFPAP